MPIHISKQDDSSSLLPISMQSEFFPGTEEKESRVIEVYPLDAILDPKEILSPALLKIDVQGYELQVLQGCEFLLDHFEYILAECSFVELYEGQALAYQVIDYLNQHGFYLAGIHNMYYEKNGTAVQGDFLFAQKKEKVDQRSEGS